jgi:hypothetical protein
MQKKKDRTNGFRKTATPVRSQNWTSSRMTQVGTRLARSEPPRRTEVQEMFPTLELKKNG